MERVVARAGLFLAAFATVLTVWVLLSAPSVEDRREGRLAARTPSIVDRGAGRAATAWYREGVDSVAERQFSVLSVIPMREDAPAPPGLPRWPHPGEAFLSPALLHAGAAEGVRERYGAFAGVIGDTGLADPAEFVVYRRPPLSVGNDLSEWIVIDGFGADPHRFASQDRDRPGDLVIWFVAVVVGLPVLLLVGTAVGAYRSAGPAAGTVAAGKRWRTRATGAWPPVLGGVGLGVAAAGWTARVGVGLPLTGYEISPDDLRFDGVIVGAIVLAAGGGLVAAATVGPIRRPGRSSRARARPAARKAMAGAGVAVGVGALLGGGIGRIVFFSGTALLLVALPALATDAFRRLGKWISDTGARRGWLSAVHSGALLRARPAFAAWATAVLGVALSLGSLLQVTQTMTNGPEARALYLRATAGVSVVELRALHLDPAGIANLRTLLGAHQVLEVHTRGGGADGPPTAMLVGSCDTLARLGQLARCPAGPAPLSDVFASRSSIGAAVAIPGVLPALGPDPDRLLVADRHAGGGPVALVVMNPSGPAGVEQIKSAGFASFAVPHMTVPGQGWLESVADSRRAVRWILGTGLLGLIPLLLCLAIRSGAVLAGDPRLAERAGSDRRRAYARAMWGIVVPLTAAGLGSAVIASMLGRVLLRIERSGSFSVTALGVAAVAVALTAVLVALVVGGSTGGPRAARTAGQAGQPEAAPRSGRQNVRMNVRSTTW